MRMKTMYMFINPTRLVNYHRPGRLVNLENLADLKIINILIGNLIYLKSYQILDNFVKLEQVL